MSRPFVTCSLCLALVACGDRGDRAGTGAARPGRILEQSSAGDEVVAEVNGQPILAGCVATQMATTGGSARAALDDCIGFELLAQAAAERGYADHPEVQETRKVETVRAVIDHEFTSHFASPEDVPEAELRAHYDRWKDRIYEVPDYRSAEYVRVEVNQKLPRGGPEDLAARQLSEQIYAAVRGRRDLTRDQLIEIAAGVAEGRPLSSSKKPFNFPIRGRAVPEFADAAFAIPEVGMVSPPTRTDWGWDVILLTRILPARHISYQEALPEMRQALFDLSRRRAFAEWTSKLSTSRPELDLAWLERLTRAEQADPLVFDPESSR